MTVLTASLFLLAGLLAGALHFALLRWNATLYARPGGLPWAIGLQLLRMIAIAALLLFAAWHGALPLLLTALGIAIARPILLRRLGRSAP